MDTDDIASLTAALRAACAELDALSRGWQAPAAIAPDAGPGPGAGTSPHASRYQEAVRQAVVALERSRTAFNSQELRTLRRALESLLLDVRR